MHIENQLARPFSRWDIAHGEGEPAYGFFARLVALEGHSSVRVYANEIGINGRNIVPAEFLASLDRLPLAEAVKSDLTRWTPILEDTVHRLGLETLRQKQVSYSRRRWCPTCLAKQAHHRIWWDVVAYRVCPHHGIALVEETERGQRLGWHWPHFDFGPDGESLTGHSGRFGEADPDGWESYLEVRLLGCDRLAFASTPLAQLIDLCAVVGKFMTGKADSEAEGFKTISLGDAGMRDAFRDRIVETVSEAKRRKGMHASIGCMTTNPIMEVPEALTERVVANLRQAFSEVGRVGRKHYKGAAVERREFTLREAAAQLGVPTKRLSKLAKEVGIGHAPWKDAHSYTENDVEHLRRYLLVNMSKYARLTLIE